MHLTSESFDRTNAKWIEQGGSFEEATAEVRRELQNRVESLTPWQAAKELEGMQREARHLGEAPGVTAGEGLDRLQSFLEGLEAIEKAFRKQRVSAQAAGVLKKASELRQAMEEKGAELREMQREEEMPERAEERPEPEEPPRPPETSEEDIPVTEQPESDRIGRENGIKSWSEISAILDKEGVNQRKIEEILATPKGNRPDPETYLSKQYVANHLSYFRDGVTKIKSQRPIGTEGVGLGTFVIPKSVADSVIKQACGDVSKLEKLLGLNPGDLGANPIRLDIPNPQNIRMPSGNEAGAWPGYWTPGGYTKPGGVMEAVIDPVPEGEYIIKQNILER